MYDNKTKKSQRNANKVMFRLSARQGSLGFGLDKRNVLISKTPHINGDK